MPTPRTIEAGATPATLNLDACSVAFDVEAKAPHGSAKRPTFDIVAYTGAVISVGGFYTPVIVDLAGMKTPGSEIPILRDHDTSRIVGQTDSVKIDAKGVRLTGTVTGDNADAAEVVSQAKNGFRWKASIGASVDRREFLEAGKTATVNGREVSGPLLIARETTLGETSFVAIGADGMTSANVAATSNPGGSLERASTMFDEWVKAKGFDPAALNDVQKASLKASYDAELAAKTPPPAPAPAPAAAPAAAQPTHSLDEIVKAQRDEDDRVKQITAMTGDAIKRRPVLIDQFELIAKTAIEGKSPVREFELAMLRTERDSPTTYVRGTGGGGGVQNNQAVIEAAVCRSGRLENIGKHFDDRTLSAADKHFKYGIGLQELLLIAARENGYSGNSAADVRGVLRAAFPQDIRAEGFSTISLPGILSNVMNKFLVDYFNSVESGWRDISSIRSVRDFKQVTSYSLSGDLQYEIVGPTGEIKYGTVSETKYTNQASTYAKMMAITRSDIINDDLGALMRIPQRLGRGAALKLNDVIWTTFLAGVGSFWAAGNNNLITGATTTMDVTNGPAALTAALLKFRKQTDPDGKPLGLSPRILLVPPEVEVGAKQMMNSTFFNTGGSATATQVANANTWQGAYRVVESTYLSNSNYTGYSTTAWYLLADPADLPTIELAVLNGREVPIIESAEAEFDTLGIQIRGYHDWGATLQEYRGSVRSAGA